MKRNNDIYTPTLIDELIQDGKRKQEQSQCARKQDGVMRRNANYGQPGGDTKYYTIEYIQ